MAAAQRPPIEARRQAAARRLRPALIKQLSTGASCSEVVIEDLLSHARMARSTFYVYFEDKGDLLLTLSARTRVELLDLALAIWAVKPSASRVTFTTAVQALTDRWADDCVLIGALIELSLTDRSVAAVAREHQAACRRACAAHIRAGQAAGAVSAAVDPESTAHWLTSMIEWGLFQMQPIDAGSQAALADVLWSALRS